LDSSFFSDTSPTRNLQTATVASQWNQKTCPSLLIHVTYFAYYTSHRVAIALLRYGPYIPTAWVDASRGKKCVRQPLRPFCRLTCARKNKKSRLGRTQQIRRHIRTQTQCNNDAEHCHLSSIFFSQQRIHRQLYLWLDPSDVVIFEFHHTLSRFDFTHTRWRIHNDGWY